MQKAWSRSTPFVVPRLIFDLVPRRQLNGRCRDFGDVFVHTPYEIWYQFIPSARSQHIRPPREAQFVGHALEDGVVAELGLTFVKKMNPSLLRLGNGG